MARYMAERVHSRRAAQSAFLEIGSCRNEPSLLKAISETSNDLFGTDYAALLVHGEDRPTASSGWRQLRDQTSRIATVPESMEECLLSGERTFVEEGALAQNGLDLPVAGTFAAVLPCSGPRSTHACLLLWPRKLEFNAATLEAMSTFGLVAGLTLERIEAKRRESERISEMENRIRNLVALVRSVSARSAERSSSLDDFVMHFDGRVDALARPQLALARSGGIALDFETLLREELLAQGISDSPEVSLQGMQVSLSPLEAEMVLLAIHELSVNAVKFGAFSGSAGQLKLRWWIEPTEKGLDFHLLWQEEGAKVKEAPAHIGFGRTIIERALPYELDATTEMTFGAKGLECRMTIPLSPRRTVRYRGIR